ncbi:hypothetical protein [Streptacidiphilus carbonis]|uniref:hypothetical protein n=1 Tax=Streptacidiphilus carbonis TaxID=105422 RepID=UPI0005A7BAC9|nr:hypothetical protein [Streptacidiphilus carbonis]
MNPVPDPNTPITVLYDADGHPHYATTVPTTAGPLVRYQPAPVQPVVYQPSPLSTASPGAQPGGYSIGRDPVAGRLLAGGIGLGAAGVGIGFFLQALAAATTALAALAAVLVLVYVLIHSGGGSSRSGAVNIRISNRNR